MLASFVPQMMHKTLPTAASGVTSVVMLLVAHTWEERVLGAGVGILEVTAPPVGGTTPPLEGPAPPAVTQLRLWIWWRVACRLAHERRRSPGFGCQSDVGARGPRLSLRP